MKSKFPNLISFTLNYQEYLELAGYEPLPEKLGQIQPTLKKCKEIINSKPSREDLIKFKQSMTLAEYRTFLASNDLSKDEKVKLEQLINSIQDASSNVQPLIQRDLGSLISISTSEENFTDLMKHWEWSPHDYAQGNMDGGLLPKILFNWLREDHVLKGAEWASDIPVERKELRFSYKNEDRTKPPAGIGILNSYPDLPFFGIAHIKNATESVDKREFNLILNKDFVPPVSKVDLFNKLIKNKEPKVIENETDLKNEFLSKIESEQIENFLLHLFEFKDGNITDIKCDNPGDIKLDIYDTNTENVKNFCKTIVEKPEVFKDKSFAYLQAPANNVPEEIIENNINEFVEVDIYSYPTRITPLNEFDVLTLGDAHSNPMLVLYTLVKFGIVEISPQKYQELAEIYQNHLKKTYSLIDRKNKSLNNNKPTLDEYRSLNRFKEILEKELKFKSKNKVIQLGDDFADRGANDLFMGHLYRVLYAKQEDENKDQIQINLSNHTLEYVKALEKMSKKRQKKLEKENRIENSNKTSKDEVKFDIEDASNKSVWPDVSKRRSEQFVNNLLEAFDDEDVEAYNEKIRTSNKKVKKYLADSMDLEHSSSNLERSQWLDQQVLAASMQHPNPNKEMDKQEIEAIKATCNEDAVIDNFDLYKSNLKLINYIKTADGKLNILTHAPCAVPDIIEKFAIYFDLPEKERVKEFIKNHKVAELAQVIDNINAHFQKEYVQTHSIYKLDCEKSPLYDLIDNRDPVSEKKDSYVINTHGHSKHQKYGPNVRFNLNGFLGQGECNATDKLRVHICNDFGAYMFAQSYYKADSLASSISENKLESSSNLESSWAEIIKKEEIHNKNAVDVQNENQNEEQSESEIKIEDDDDDAEVVEAFTGELPLEDIKIKPPEINKIVHAHILFPQASEEEKNNKAEELNKGAEEIMTGDVRVFLYRLKNNKILAVPTFRTTNHEISYKDCIAEAVEKKLQEAGRPEKLEDVAILAVAGKPGRKELWNNDPVHAVCALKRFGEGKDGIFFEDARTGLKSLLINILSYIPGISYFLPKAEEKIQGSLNDVICTYSSLILFSYIFSALNNGETLIYEKNAKRLPKGFYDQINNNSELKRFVDKLQLQNAYIPYEDKEKQIYDLTSILKHILPNHIEEISEKSAPKKELGLDSGEEKREYQEEKQENQYEEQKNQNEERYSNSGIMQEKIEEKKDENKGPNLNSSAVEDLHNLLSQPHIKKRPVASIEAHSQEKSRPKKTNESVFSQPSEHIEEQKEQTDLKESQKVSRELSSSDHDQDLEDTAENLERGTPPGPGLRNTDGPKTSPTDQLSRALVKEDKKDRTHKDDIENAVPEKIANIDPRDFAPTQPDLPQSKDPVEEENQNAGNAPHSISHAVDQPDSLKNSKPSEKPKLLKSNSYVAKEDDSAFKKEQEIQAASDKKREDLSIEVEQLQRLRKETIEAFKNKFNKLFKTFESDLNKLEVTKNLHDDLKNLTDNFFKKDITESAYNTFKEQCKEKIDFSQTQIKKLPLQNKIHSFIEAFLGLVTLLPFAIALSITGALLSGAIVLGLTAFKYSDEETRVQQVIEKHNKKIDDFNKAIEDVLIKDIVKYSEDIQKKSNENSKKDSANPSVLENSIFKVESNPDKALAPKTNLAPKSNLAQNSNMQGAQGKEDPSDKKEPSDHAEISYNKNNNS